MPSTNDFLSKPLISLQEGKNCGIVTNMLFDANLKKVTDVLIFDQIESAYYLLSANKIKFMENDAVVTETSYDLLPYDDNAFNPINFDVFDVRGKHIGIVTEIILTKNYAVQSIECNGLHLTPSQIYSHSNGTLVIKTSTQKMPRPKRTVKKKQEPLPTFSPEAQNGDMTQNAENFFVSQDVSISQNQPESIDGDSQPTQETNELETVAQENIANENLQALQNEEVKENSELIDSTRNENSMEEITEKEAEEITESPNQPAQELQADGDIFQTEEIDVQSVLQDGEELQPIDSAQNNAEILQDNNETEQPSVDLQTAADIFQNDYDAQDDNEQENSAGDNEEIYISQYDDESIAANYTVADYAEEPSSENTPPQDSANKNTYAMPADNVDEQTTVEQAPQSNADETIVAVPTNDAQNETAEMQNNGISENIANDNAVATETQTAENATQANSQNNENANSFQTAQVDTVNEHATDNTQYRADNIKNTNIKAEQSQQQLGSNRTVTGTGTFMLGRHCDKNIMNRFNEIIVKKGSLITSETIKKAKINGKLLELSLHAK